MTRFEKDGISADIYVPSDSPWFSGHFPADPILPGVAQVRMVLDTISSARSQDLKVTGVRRVRFKQIIRPEDPLTIKATPLEKNNSDYSFRIAVEDETVCSGVMTVKQQDNQFEHKEEMYRDVNGNQR